MAITQSSAPNNAERSAKNKNRIIASVWLIMALLTGAAALALWMFSSAPAFEEQAAEKEVPAEVLASHIDQITHIEQLNELSSEVKPISFDALVRELRDYPEEFKDSRYLKKNKGKWTLQVMDVSEHEIISDYLSSRDDRNKFAYFRYRDANNQPRYILTYNVMMSEQSALNTANDVDFALPANVEVTPEQISDYLDVIEDYELSGPIKDLSKNKPRKVKLQPTKSELAARPSTEESQTPNDADNNSSTNGNSVPARAIRGSTDTNETLSVQEQRNVVTQGSNNNQQSAPEESNPSRDEPSRPRSEPTQPRTEPTKPQEVQQNRSNENNSADRDQSNQNSQGGQNNQVNSGEEDSIRQLIEQRSQ